jgi:hypothetical protein
MAQEIINIGTAPNDGSGDSVRTSFNKVNKNFTELYGLKDTVKKLTNGPFVVQLTSDGSLILPANGSIKNTASAGFRIIAQTNATGQTSVSANMVDVILNDPVQSAAIKDSPTNFEIIFNGGFTATITGTVGKTKPGERWTLIGSWPANPNGAPLIIRTKNYVEGTAGIKVSTNGKNWTFGNDGKLKLPLNGDIVDVAGNSVLGLRGANSLDFDFGYFKNIFTNPISYFLDSVGMDFGIIVPNFDLGTILNPGSRSINFGTFAPLIELGSIVKPNPQKIDFGSFAPSVDFGSILNPRRQTIDFGTFAPSVDFGSILNPRRQTIDFGTFAPSIDLGSILQPSTQLLDFQTILNPSTRSIDLGPTIVVRSIDLGAVSESIARSIDLGAILESIAQSIDLGEIVQTTAPPIDLGPLVQVGDLSIDLGTF